MKTPKYQSIFTELRERCSRLPVETRLPPERQLAADFDVSLMTVRQALAELAAGGWIERIPGSGTYVRRPRIEMGPSFTSFTEDMRRRHLRPSSLLMGLDTVPADERVATELGVIPGDDVLEVERLRLADREPMCHELAHLPAALRGMIDSSDLEGEIREACAKAGLVMASAVRRVRAVVAPPRECRLLGLPPESPALEIVDTFYDSHSRPAQTARSRYRFDRYEMLSTVGPSPDSPRGA
ncbi:GntR family transcriptional regulator [Phytoactinopolyspora alkaliphila]|uniref:GntR family transcriptional regulator n=1 Tax=Phytoactinopolyspora alkaliphila TaxID=1783498 RepID=A0A6N9YM23_9ACTN|nr:GntR family transcriptional regulator [Phytoactinopolyspora alkaliphila]NED96012.1 GntR family transcriptional regulator [Phytoactinopolyspora alkaliphila]